MTTGPAHREKWDLFLTFSVGLGIMAVEMIVSRLLAPYFGASLFVWTSLILTILIALAFGYWFGGRLAEKNADGNVVGLMLASVGGLLAAGIWLSGSLSVSVISVLAAWPHAGIALFLGSLVSVAAIFALPVMVMGALGPILMKRLAAGGDVGRASGRYLFFSTLGSAAGTLLPVLVLIPNIGSRRSLAVIALFLAAIGLVSLRRGRKWLALPMILIVLAAAVRGVPDGQTLFAVESPYQLIRITEEDGRRSLIYNEGSGTQSVYDPGGNVRTGMYYDYFSLLPLVRPFHDGEHRVAVIGLAGGTAVRRYPVFLPPGVSIEYVGVEIDPAVIEAARRWLGLDDLPVRVVIQDGRNFLRTAVDKFDSIIVDAYSTQLYIPPHLATKEFFALARARLKPGGLLAININVTGTDSALYRSLTASVADQFPDAVAIPVSGRYNYVILASDEPIDTERLAEQVPSGYEDIRMALAEAVSILPAGDGAAALTDDWAPVEFMTDAMAVSEVLRLGRGLTPSQSQ